MQLRRLFVTLGLLASLWGAQASANDIWLSLNGTGTQSGLDSANTKTFDSFRNLACSATPTGVQVGPGTVAHLTGVGTYNNYGPPGFPMLIVPCSGATGNPVVVQAENGFIAQSSAFGALGAAAIITHGNSWVTLDGRNVGIIKNTNNGSAPLGFANHVDSHLIYVQGGANIVVKQWILQTACVHSFNIVGQCDATTLGPSAPSAFVNGACILGEGVSNFTVTLNTLSDCDEAIGETAPLGTSTGNIYSFNTISRSNWGIGLGAANTGNHINGAKIFGNNMFDFVNWDEANSGGHHNGVILFVGQGSGSVDQVKVYDNKFTGDFGFRQTGGVFMDPNLQTGPVTHTMIFNNLFNVTGHAPSNSFFNGLNSGSIAVNNTVITSGVNAGTGCGSTNFGNTTAVFQNNICYRTATGTYINSGASMAMSDYNDFFQQANPGFWMYDGNQGFATLAAWVTRWNTTTHFDQHSIIADPNLNLTTFVPNSGSPVINAGVNLTSLGIPELNVDFNGNARPGGTLTPWTMGAFNAGSSGTVVSISVAPNPLAFGSQTTGSNTPSSTTVTSTGTAPLVLGTPALVLGGTDAGQFSLTGGGCANGQTVTSTCSANVTFSPTSAGAKTATLTINSNANTAPTVVNLTGTGTVPVSPLLTPAPTSAVFGNANVGQTSAPITITLTSSGATVNLSNPFFTIAGAVFARSGGTCVNSMVLTPPASCTVLVTATPAALGAATSNLVINSNSSPGVSVPLSVTGTAPSLTVAPTSFDFGSQIQGTQGPLHNFTITNNGTGPATMGNPYFSFSDPQFARVSPGGADCINGGSLAAGANCLISVAFTPSAVGARSGVLSILSNAPTVTSALTGTGTSSTPAPVMTPASFAFPSTTTGTTSSTTVTFTLTNNGSSLTLANPPGNLTGANASDFTLIGGTCAAGTVLGTTASCTYTYNFHPATAGAKAARANSTGSVTTSSGLTGTGVDPVLSIQLTPRPLNFPNQTIGVISAVALVTVTNNGAASVTIATGGAVLGGANPGDFSISSSGATTCHDGLALAVAATCNYGLQITPSFAAPPAESATFTVTTTAGVSDFIQLNGSGVALFPPPSPAPAQLVGITLPGYFVNWYGPADFFGIVGSGFVAGKTAITLDGQPLPTTCLNAESCSATLPLAMVLLPGFAGSPHTIGVK